MTEQQPQQSQQPQQEAVPLQHRCAFAWVWAGPVWTDRARCMSCGAEKTLSRTEARGVTH